MTTEKKEEPLSANEQRPIEPTMESALIDSILKGEEENAVRAASEMSKELHESNDVIDAISEAMNIATDLHEVEKYTTDQVEKSERAAERALEAVKGKIRVEQKRIQGRVLVASLTGDPHSFEHTLMLTMLKACGFTPLDGGADLSPEQLRDAVKSLKPDVLAVSILTPAALGQLRTSLTMLKTEKKHAVGIVAFGRGAGNVAPKEGLPGSFEQDSIGAVSRIAEMLIANE